MNNVSAKDPSISSVSGQRGSLRTQLWNVANTLRGKMNADEFRDYILGFIFYKYLSEKFEAYADQLLQSDNRKYAELDENSEDVEYFEFIREEAVNDIGYFLKPSELFHVIAEKGAQKQDNFILPALKRALQQIEQSTVGHDSSDDFINLFEDIDLTSSKLGKSEKDKNDLICKVLSHLNEIDFNLKNFELDVLGDAYEYLIGEFASSAGKKAGEFYTPQKVSTLLARLVTCEKRKLRSVYDPTCGSGSLLLRVKKEAESVGKIYGQELNRTTYNLARMNLLLHDVPYNEFDLKQEDTLKRPQHREMRFDAIVANPPFSSRWEPDILTMDDERFAVYGKLAPASKADFAFVQHMIYQLSEDGVCAVIMPHGVLFRSGAEAVIRKHMIGHMNVLDAVIGLPASLFYGTGIPACVLVLKKCRKQPDNILFIDASRHFAKVKTQNILRDEDIDRIMSAYQERQDIDKFAHVASIQEIAGNDYNLNIPRYVDTFEEEEAINLRTVANEIISLEAKLEKNHQTIMKFCKELAIEVPFTVKGIQ